MSEQNLTISHWRHYGHDRLYIVRERDLVAIGWFDLKTNTPHPDEPEHLDAIIAAVKEWKAEKGCPSPVPVAPAPAPG